MKRYIALLLVILLIFFCNGCTPLYGVLDLVHGNSVVTDIAAVPHIAFSKGEMDLHGEKTVMTTDQLPYTALISPDYRSTLHFDTLPDNEKLLYRIYEYAMENGYTNVWVDRQLIPDQDDLEKVLYYLSLDSPLLEQNLRFECGSFTASYPVRILDLYDREVPFIGNYISVKNFDAVYWEKKLLAIETAEMVVNAIPHGLSEAEKAERLYLHLCKNSSYLPYEEEGDVTDNVYNYLYDGLVVGKTHCDGFTNAYGLLLQIADIECIEKVSFADYGEAVGHTWNSIRLNGMWYNSDATYGLENRPKKNSGMGAGLFFAYPDLLLENQPQYAWLYPPCNDSIYIPVDAHLKTTDGLYTALRKAYGSHNTRWALVVVDMYNQKQVTSAMQSLANHFQCRLIYEEYELENRRTALFVYDPRWIDE